MAIVDLDGDGKDEIINGGLVLDYNGNVLSSALKEFQVSTHHDGMYIDDRLVLPPPTNCTLETVTNPPPEEPYASIALGRNCGGRRLAALSWSQSNLTKGECRYNLCLWK
ncbi:MAG: hypothetical protein ACI9R3_002094 [Verrucomicrobiales bacterium]|jgi:hypothetical protein